MEFARGSCCVRSISAKEMENRHSLRTFAVHMRYSDIYI